MQQSAILELIPKRSQLIQLNQRWLGLEASSWKLLKSKSTYKVYKKNYLIFSDYLYLSFEADPVSLIDTVLLFYSDFRARRLVIRTFDQGIANLRNYISVQRAVPSVSRSVFYDHTFIVPTQSFDERLAMPIGSTLRSKIKRAQRAGYTVTSNLSPSFNDIAKFWSSYKHFSRIRKIRCPHLQSLIYLMEAKSLHLFHLFSSSIHVSSLLIGIAPPNALFLYGFSESGASNGGGYLLHSEAIKSLAHSNIKYYDLCGFPALSDADGIYRFKKALLGDLYSFGNELHIYSHWAKRIGFDQ